MIKKIIFLSVLSFYAFSGVKYVDNFEKKKNKNLLGGKYFILPETSGNIKFNTEFPYRGKYCLEVDFRLKKNHSFKLICDLNGLDISKGEYFIFYINPLKNVRKVKITLKDLEGKEENFILKFFMKGWRKIKIPFSQFKNIDINGLSSFEISLTTDRKIEGIFLIDEIKFEGNGDIFFLSLRDNLLGFPGKKIKIPPKNLSDKEFLMKIEEDTFKHFYYLIDKRTGLPVDWVETDEKYKFRIGDYTSPTNIGLYLMVLTAGEKMGFIGRNETIERIKKVFTTLNSLKKYKGLFYNWYSTTNLKPTTDYISTVDNGWLAAGLIVIEIAYPEFSKISREMLDKMNFNFLYDPVYGQFYLGYHTEKKKFSPYHYGLIATEPRVSSFIAIGKGDVPYTHWFRIYRTLPKVWKWQRQKPEGHLVNYFGIDVFEGYYRFKNFKIVPSWGGSLFEFLMPVIVMDEIKLAPYGLGLNDINAAKIHYLYGEEKYNLWGFSPCAIPGNDTYGEFGIPEIGTKGYPEEGIITPYASALAIEILPNKVIENFREMIEKFPEIYGEYGFFDSVDVKNKVVSTRYLTLDQAMIFLPIANYLKKGIIRKYFHSHPYIKKSENLLKTERFFVKPVKKEIKKILVFFDFNNGSRRTKYGEFGCWKINEKDINQQVIDSFVREDIKGEGFSLQVFYNLKDEEGGVWMDLKNLKIDDWKYLGFWIKGDKEKGFTKTIKIEIENEKGEKGYYFITDIDNNWKREIIPLDEIMGMGEIKIIKKINFVLAPEILSKKKGMIYIDNLFLGK